LKEKQMAQMMKGALLSIILLFIGPREGFTVRIAAVNKLTPIVHDAIDIYTTTAKNGSGELVTCIFIAK
jgi:hypothetical protein